MSKPHEPELGELLFWRPHATSEYDLPAFGEACFWMAKRELGRVYWNVHQEEFEDRGLYPPGHQPFGVTWRAYDWSDEPDDIPNFAWGGVEIRWYKYPGRGMNVNVDWTPDQWSKWLNEFLVYMHKVDQENNEKITKGE